MKISKEMARECLKTLYNLEGNSQNGKIMYDNLMKYIEENEPENIKETKEFKDMERQWFLENQLCRIYKARLKKIDNIITGRFDDK